MAGMTPGHPARPEPDVPVRPQAEAVAPHAAGTNQASAESEDLGRPVIGRIDAPTEGRRCGAETRSQSRGRSQRLVRQQPVAARPAHRQTGADLGIGVIIAAAIASARPGGPGRDGHRRRHQATLDEREAHPDRQEEREEEDSNSMPRPASHRGANMAASNADGKAHDSGVVSRTSLTAGPDSGIGRGPVATRHHPKAQRVRSPGASAAAPKAGR
jgi:hypothetical protein